MWTLNWQRVCKQRNYAANSTRRQVQGNLWKLQVMGHGRDRAILNATCQEMQSWLARKFYVFTVIEVSDFIFL